MSAQQIAPVPNGEVRLSLAYVPGIEGPLSDIKLSDRFLAFSYGERSWQRGSSGGQAKNAASESWRKHKDRIKAMWDARDLCSYDWIGGALGKVVVYIVGELECKSNTGDPQIDALYDQYFHNWCGDDHDEDGFYGPPKDTRNQMGGLLTAAGGTGAATLLANALLKRRRPSSPANHATH